MSAAAALRLLPTLLNPRHNVVGLEPHARPKPDRRQAKISAKPANMPRRTPQKPRHVLQRPKRIYLPLLSAAVAPVHSLSRPVNRCHLLSQIIHSDGGHKRALGGLVSSRFCERRSLVISVLLLHGMGGLPEQKSVKLKNVSSWDFTGGLPTLGHERLT